MAGERELELVLLLRPLRSPKLEMERVPCGVEVIVISP